jgi:hypothetical protein
MTTATARASLAILAACEARDDAAHLLSVKQQPQPEASP